MSRENDRIRWWAVELLSHRKFKHATVLALHCYKQSFTRCDTVELLENVLLLGKCLCKQQMFPEALRCAQDAEAYINGSNVALEVVGEVLLAVGELYSSVGKVSKATECFFRHCLAVEELLGPDHVRLSDANTILSVSLAKQGKFEEALRYGIKALKIRQKHFGSNSKYTADSHYNVGLLHRSLGLLDQARRHFSAGIEARKYIFGVHSLPVADIEVSLAFTQEQRGYYNDAINRYYRAFRIRRKLLGVSHEHTQDVKCMLDSAKIRTKGDAGTVLNEDRLLDPKIIANAIDEINKCIYLKNVTRRCFALNPYLRAELVHATSIVRGSKAMLMKRFYKYQDLLDDLLQEIEYSNKHSNITPAHLINSIDRLLSKATEKTFITSQMKNEIVSACPLTVSQLENLFKGDRVLTCNLAYAVSTK